MSQFTPYLYIRDINFSMALFKKNVKKHAKTS